MARGLQKAQAQAKNAADNQKTPEQRAADRKLAAANSTGQVCQLCRQTFSNVAKEPMLRSHWESSARLAAPTRHPLKLQPDTLSRHDPNSRPCVRNALSSLGTARVARQSTRRRRTF